MLLNRYPKGFCVFRILSYTYRHYEQRGHVEQAEIHHIEKLRVIFPSVRYTYSFHMPVSQVVRDCFHPDELGGTVRCTRDPHSENHHLPKEFTINTSTYLPKYNKVGNVNKT